MSGTTENVTDMYGLMSYPQQGQGQGQGSWEKWGRRSGRSRRLTRRQRLRRALIRKELDQLTDREYNQEVYVDEARVRGLQHEQELYEASQEASRKADAQDPERRYKREEREARQHYIRSLQRSGVYNVKPESSLHGVKLTSEERILQRKYTAELLKVNPELDHLRELYVQDCRRAREGIPDEEYLKEELDYLWRMYTKERRQVVPKMPEDLLKARRRSKKRLVPVDGVYLDVPHIPHQNHVPVVAHKGGKKTAMVLHGQSKVSEKVSEDENMRPKRFDAEFVKKVRSAREKLGMSQKEVAMMIQRHETEYSAFERGEMLFDTSLKSMLQWKVLNQLLRKERDAAASASAATA